MIKVRRGSTLDLAVCLKPHLVSSESATTLPPLQTWAFASFLVLRLFSEVRTLLLLCNWKRTDCRRLLLLQYTAYCRNRSSMRYLKCVQFHDCFWVKPYTTYCQRTVSRRREAARRQLNRAVCDCSRGRKNLESMKHDVMQDRECFVFERTRDTDQGIHEPCACLWVPCSSRRQPIIWWIISIQRDICRICPLEFHIACC